MSNKLLYVFVLSIISCSIELDISIPSLPDISNYFLITDGQTQMTIAINFLGFCISAVFYGPISESLGRRKVMIVGNTIMFIGSLGCFVAESYTFLLLSRFIQGIGASTSAVIVFAMIADLCNNNERTRIVGQMNSMITIIMAISPVIGGFINQTIGWRGNYFVVSLISFFSLLVIYFYLPETKKNLTKFSAKKFLSDYFLLLSNKVFMFCSLIPSFMFAAYISFISCASFLYMETYGLSILYYAFCQGLMSLCFSLVSERSSVIIKSCGEYNSLCIGFLALISGSLCMLLFALLAIDGPVSVTFCMLVGSVGAAICYPMIFAKSFEIFPEIKGTSSSAIMSVRMLLSSLVVAIVSMAYNGNLTNVAAIIFVVNILGMLLTINIMRSIRFE